MVVLESQGLNYNHICTQNLNLSMLMQSLYKETALEEPTAQHKQSSSSNLECGTQRQLGHKAVSANVEMT